MPISLRSRFRTACDMTDPDAASRYFIAQGSYLRREGKLVLDSLSKVFLVAEDRVTDLKCCSKANPSSMPIFARSSRPKPWWLTGPATRRLMMKQPKC